MQKYLRGQVWWCKNVYDVNNGEREIDLTDKHLDIHKQVVLEELEKLGAINIPRITIYNKIDILTSEEKLRLRNSDIIEQDSIFISAKENENIENIKEAILNKLFKK